MLNLEIIDLVKNPNSYIVKIDTSLNLSVLSFLISQVIMAVEYNSCNMSTTFCENVHNMLPFNSHSVWNFACNDSLKKRSREPIITGASVLGIAFDKGVMICADTLGSHGSMRCFLNCQRVVKVNDQTLLGAGGDIADFQYVQSIIEKSVIDDECLNDGFNLKPKSLHCWLTRILYNRRSKLNPLWNVFAVGGMQDGVPFLGYVDKIGTSFESKTIATGFGACLAQPMLRDASEKNPVMTQIEAQELLHQCMQVLFARDSKALSRYTLGIVTKEGVKVTGSLPITIDWNIHQYNVDT